MSALAGEVWVSGTVLWLFVPDYVHHCSTICWENSRCSFSAHPLYNIKTWIKMKINIPGFSCFHCKSPNGSNISDCFIGNCSWLSNLNTGVCCQVYTEHTVIIIIIIHRWFLWHRKIINNSRAPYNTHLIYTKH